MERKTTEWVVIQKASPLMSFIEDAVSFGGFIAVLWFNHRYLNGNWFIDLLFIIGWLMTLASMQSRRYHKFANIIDAAAYLNKAKKAADNETVF